MSIESPVTHAKHFFAGTDRQLRFTVRDDDGNVIDITGWTLEWVLRHSDEGAALITKTTDPGDGITVTAPTTGIALVEFDPVDTALLDPGQYVYALRRTDMDFVDILAFGVFELLRAAAR